MLRAAVGPAAPARRRRSPDESPLASMHVSAELHADGAGVFSMSIFDLLEQQDTSSLQAPIRGIAGFTTRAWFLLSCPGCCTWPEDARDRAAAGGDALIHAQIHPGHPERPSRTRAQPALWLPRRARCPRPDGGAASGRGGRRTGRPCAARPGACRGNRAADQRDWPGIGLVQMFQITRDGEFRRRYWADQQVITWAGQNGIGVTDDIVG